MKKIKIILFAVIIGNQLNAQESFKDKQVRKYFSEDEIPVLESIIAFVDSSITNDNNNIRTAYLKFFNSLDSAYTFYHITSKNEDKSFFFSLNQDQKERFLFNLPSDVFNKIWTVQIPRIVKTRDTTLYNPENFWSFSLNNNGDYLNLLKALGRKDRYYKEISKAIETCGDLCPTIAAGMLTKINNFNFSDFNDRLWIAIFLITLEEPTEIRVSKYLAK